VKNTTIITIKCEECKGSGVRGLGPCPACGGDPRDPDSTSGSGYISINFELFKKFLSEAIRTGLIKAGDYI